MELYTNFLKNRVHLGFLKFNLNNTNNYYMMGLKKRFTVIDIRSSVNAMMQVFTFLKSLIYSRGQILVINLDPDCEELFENISASPNCIYVQGWSPGYLTKKTSGAKMYNVDFVFIFNFNNLNIATNELDKFDVPVFMFCDSFSNLNKLHFWVHGSSTERSALFLFGLFEDFLKTFMIGSNRKFIFKKRKKSKLVVKKTYLFIYGLKKKRFKKMKYKKSHKAWTA